MYDESSTQLPLDGRSSIRPTTVSATPSTRAKDTARLRPRSLITDARILRPLAGPAGVRFQLEAEVLRLGVGGLLELHDDVVAVAFGQLGLADQHVAFLLKLYRILSAFGVRDDGHGL